MATEYLTGAPVKIRTFKSTWTQPTNTGSPLTSSTISNTADNGVFVGVGTIWNAGSNSPPSRGYGDTVIRESTKRPTFDPRNALSGKINMDTKSATYVISLQCSTYDTWSSNGRTYHGYGIFMRRGAIPTGELLIPYGCSDTNDNCGIIATALDDAAQYVTGTTEKTEFFWSKEYTNSVGVLGYTFYSASNATGGIRMPKSTGPFDKWSSYSEANNDATKSFILCRVVPTDHEGLTYEGDSISNNFVVFDGLCDYVLGSSGDPSAVGEPIARLVPSLTKSQVASNTGMLAVAVMAKGSTKAYYLGNKNSVYKLYNGAEPYIMPPGSIVNIGKKSFQSIAYSSYYVKLN